MASPGMSKYLSNKLVGLYISLEYLGIKEVTVFSTNLFLSENNMKVMFYALLYF